MPEKNNKTIKKKQQNVIQKKEEVKDTSKGAAQVAAKSVYGEKRKFRKGPKKKFRDESKDEFEQRILDLARVTRVMAGGKRMRFRATVAVGDKKGKVGIGMGKGADVTIAVTKAVNDAKKKIIDVSIVNDTIPHEIYKKQGAARILFKPAKKGRGVIAGGVVRIILELSGIKNITSKILGTNNKVNNAKCTIEALKELKQIGKKKESVKIKEKLVNTKKTTESTSVQSASLRNEQKNLSRVADKAGDKTK